MENDKRAAYFIPLVDKLPELDGMLIALLKDLSPEDWERPTVAKLWKVRDAAAHLLDGNIRVLSGLRDGHYYTGPGLNPNDNLLEYINSINAEWVNTMKRVSPPVITMLLECTGREFSDYYKTLDPHAPAAWAVSWAGEKKSRNWMHLAREYSEKFLHQQQIREATNRPGLLTEELYHPFLSVCMLALPYHLRHTRIGDDTVIALTVTGVGGGTWYAWNDIGEWHLRDSPGKYEVSARITIPGHEAWKLFSKSIRAYHIRDQIQVVGNPALAEEVLEMVSFIA